MPTPLIPYDLAAYEHFCSDLVAAGFSPTPGSERRQWVGPIRESLRALTTEATMQIVFRDGWPFKYAHVLVDEMSVDHSGNDIICLWGEDDPAQLHGVTLHGLFGRLDSWAEAALMGFHVEDQALDSYIAFEGTAQRFAELDLPNLLRSATNGHIAPLYGRVQQSALLLDRDQSDDRNLTGVLYYRTGIDRPPRTLEQFRDVLTRRQLQNFDRGLAQRADVGQNEPSGGYDHAVLVWPRHTAQDALVLSFSGTGNTLKAYPNAPSPTDHRSRLRRAGPDAAILCGKRVLLAGLGAIGSQVAVTLAHSGLGHLTIRDSDVLKSVNLVRHAGTVHDVGYEKTASTCARIWGSAPWCTLSADGSLPLDPLSLAPQLAGYDLIIDCTGDFSVTSALAHTCAHEQIPLLTAALYHRGGILRIRRQSGDDTPILDRPNRASYLHLPPDSENPEPGGFLELGCTALVHNAPPAATLRAAADAVTAATDYLTGRKELPDETIMVLRPLEMPPFDQPGLVTTSSVTSLGLVGV